MNSIRSLIVLQAISGVNDEFDKSETLKHSTLS